MKRLLLLVTIGLALIVGPNICWAITPQEVQILEEAERHHLLERKNEIIVKYRDGVSSSLADGVSSSIAERERIGFGMEILRMKESVDLERVMNEIKNDSAVEFVERNTLLHEGDISPGTSAHYQEMLKKRSSFQGGSEAQAIEDSGSERLQNIQDILAGRMTGSNEIRAQESDTIFEQEPNNNLEEANTVSLDKFIAGTITDAYYDIDYYELNITQAGKLNILGVFGGYEEYLAIGLYDSAENLLGFSELWLGSTGQAQVLSEQVPPGTYYVVVFQVSPYQYLLVDQMYVFEAWMTDILPYVPVTSVILNKNDLTMVKGGSEPLVATLRSRDRISHS